MAFSMWVCILFNSFKLLCNIPGYSYPIIYLIISNDHPYTYISVPLYRNLSYKMLETINSLRTHLVCSAPCYPHLTHNS
jgi:hypothetical protein